MIRGRDAAARPPARWSARRPLTPHPRTGARGGFPRRWGPEAAPSAPAPEERASSRRLRVLPSGGARGRDPDFTPPAPGMPAWFPAPFSVK